ncbi:MAG TPA: adenylate/guanylate cyclase domain-containing protein, partial [Actinomycetota bacterium]|nr:adenylate/guanylate cyclase domain-containing protein [Actinomycetota bacterium]
MQRRRAGSRLGAVLFTDIVSSTLLAAEMGNTRWAELVARHHRTIRRLLDRFGGREEDTAGDGFFATFDRPADAIRCAAAAADEVRELGIEIRAGVAFGELERVGDKAGGLVVNTAARVMAVAGPGEVLVPASVKDLVPGSGVDFGEHGVHRLKGLDGEFRLFRVIAVDGEASAPPLGADEAAERRREIVPTPGGRRTSLIVGIAAALLALGVVAVVLVTSREAPTIPPSSPGPLRDAVAQLDPSDG